MTPEVSAALSIARRCSEISRMVNAANECSVAIDEQGASLGEMSTEALKSYRKATEDALRVLEGLHTKQQLEASCSRRASFDSDN
jgi:hypothetical protein